MTVELSAVALPLGLGFGLLIGLGCALGGRAARIALLCWIDLFRAFPVLVLLILITYALPFLGLTLPTFAAAVAALVLNNSGYYGEIFRAGLASVPHGQREAAAALGLSPFRAMLLVVLPQALRAVLAPLASNSLELVKATSVAAMVSLPELLRSARVAQEQTYNPTPLMAAAVLYVVLLLALRASGGAAGTAHAAREGAMSGRLAGRVALVTGGASGIGRAIAVRFAREGAAVVIADITEQVREGGAPTHAMLAAEGLPVSQVAADVSNEADCEAAVAATLARHGRLDILVNDAAIGLGKPLLDCSRADWDRVLAVNLTGCFLMCRAAVRQMVTAGAAGGWPARRARADRQHLLAARHGRLAGGHRLWHVQGRRRLPDAAGGGGLCGAGHPLQCGGAGQDPDRKDRPGGGAALARLLAVPHALATAGTAGGRRGRRPLPRLGRRAIRHRREPDGGWRLDGLLKPITREVIDPVPRPCSPARLAAGDAPCRMPARSLSPSSSPCR
ncbi:SDR family NAD(P)-dependent oxidoreductase [Dankookia sp. P2]|uniref:SDR family NAD(P)-dependent oxidoreductase n=1 Tax=Dankookia sp. P2 TaxID=3423955 RepID=UPI003D671670